MLALFLPALLGSGVAAAFSLRDRAAQFIVILGAVSQVIGVGLLDSLPRDYPVATYWDTLYQAIIGLSFGLVVTSTLLQSGTSYIRRVASISHSLSALASFQLILVGGIVGVAVGDALVRSQLSVNDAASLKTAKLPASIVSSRGQQVDAARRAFNLAVDMHFRIVLYVALAIVLTSVLALDCLNLFTTIPKQPENASLPQLTSVGHVQHCAMPRQDSANTQGSAPSRDPSSHPLAQNPPSLAPSLLSADIPRQLRAGRRPSELFLRASSRQRQPSTTAYERPQTRASSVSEMTERRPSTVNRHTHEQRHVAPLLPSISSLAEEQQHFSQQPLSRISQYSSLRSRKASLHRSGSRSAPNRSAPNSPPQPRYQPPQIPPIVPIAPLAPWRRGTIASTSTDVAETRLDRLSAWLSCTNASNQQTGPAFRDPFIDQGTILGTTAHHHTRGSSLDWWLRKSSECSVWSLAQPASPLAENLNSDQENTAPHDPRDRSLPDLPDSPMPNESLYDLSVRSDRQHDHECDTWDGPPREDRELVELNRMIAGMPM